MFRLTMVVCGMVVFCGFTACTNALAPEPAQSVSAVSEALSVRAAVAGESGAVPASDAVRSLAVGPAETCTKFCKDCQTCEPYCCQGTTIEDLSTIYVDD